MSDELWGPIEVSKWPEVPATKNRLADENDVREGRAVFYQIGEAAVAIWPAGLPALAVLTNEEGRRIPVVVIQAERSPNGRTIAGARYFDGGNLVCTAEELRPADPDEVKELLGARP
jgi:hypothetical protein